MFPPTFSCEVRCDLHAAVGEQAGERAVHDRGADLRLDVVADDRQVGLLEAPVPVVLAGDEHGDAVDEAAAGLEHLLDVPLGGLLGADRQVGDDHVGVGVLEDLHDVGGLAGGLFDLLLEVLAEAVVGHAAVDGHAELLDGTLANLIVLFCPAQIAWPRSLPTLVESMSKAAVNSMSRTW